MPYHMKRNDGAWCVYAGTSDNPGEQKKCYSGSDAKNKARKYLAALYANAPDTKDAQSKQDWLYFLLGGMFKAYHEVDDSIQHRWVAVSTVAEWDRAGEMMTTDAMDYDIERAGSTGDYPELRLWHVRGFKIGKCDRMTRVGPYAVDYGYWYDTPLAKSMMSIVRGNDGTWRISRGFYPVKATGHCVNCDSGLMVGPAQFMFGMRCPVCKTAYVSPSALAKLKYVQTYTYDISITDAPIVPSTAVSMWSAATKTNQ